MRDVVFFRGWPPRRGDSCCKARLWISLQAAGLTRGGRDKENKEVRGRVCASATVSLLVPMWVSNVRIPELFGASQSPAGGRPASAKVVVKTSFVRAGTGTAGVCNMLPKKLSACEFFLLVC